MNENKQEIMKIYTLIKGIYQGVKEADYQLVENSTFEQYNQLLNKIYEITQDDYFRMLKIEEVDIGDYGGERKCAKYFS